MNTLIPEGIIHHQQREKKELGLYVMYLVMGPDVTCAVERIGCIVLLQQKCAILLHPPWNHSVGNSDIISIFLS